MCIRDSRRSLVGDGDGIGHAGHPVRRGGEGGGASRRRRHQARGVDEMCIRDSPYVITICQHDSICKGDDCYVD